MKVLVAGGTGTIGLPLVKALAAAGHQVTALSRSTTRHEELRAAGVDVVVADAFDRDALGRALEQVHPTHVVHQLTALPKDGPRRAADIELTNRLRTEGTRNLLEASIGAGVQRFVAGSFAVLAAGSNGSGAAANPAVAAVKSMEAQVLEAHARRKIDGLVLRYGMFYGLEAPSTVAMIDMVRRRQLPVIRGDAGALPMIHVADAVAATMLALEHGTGGSIYEIVDDRSVSMTEYARAMAQHAGAKPPLAVPAWVPRLIAPLVVRMSAVNLRLSNDKAKQELGWRPRYPTIHEGLAAMFGDARA